MSFGITLRIMSYNRPDYLKQALDSAFDQTAPFHSIEVYDNGSGPEVLRFLEQYGRGIKIRSFTQNSKTTWECAFGDPSRADFICVFHDDDVFYENFVSSNLAAFRAMPELSVHSCNGIRIDDVGRPFGDLIPGLDRDILFSSPPELASWCLDRCVPYGPSVYRQEFSLLEKFSGALRYGRVGDIAFQFLLLRDGPVFLSKAPLYGCRLDGKNDSQNLGFPEFEAVSRIFEEHLDRYPAHRNKIRRIRSRQYLEKWLNGWLAGEPKLPRFPFFHASIPGLHRFARNQKFKILRRLLGGF
jgi:glycosyltransferase involved in cell wall biosynthesis